jgi:hypothetical protein
MDGFFIARMLRGIQVAHEYLFVKQTVRKRRLPVK